jgi:hypothetical protein
MVTQLVLPELVEAAVRTGKRDLAVEALRRLTAMTVIDGADWGKGLEARSRALISEGHDAEHCYVCRSTLRWGALGPQRRRLTGVHDGRHSGARGDD